MAKYTRVVRSSTGKTTSDATDKLQAQFLSQLTTEANKVLTQLTQQFTESLQNQTSQLLQGLSDNTSSDGLPTVAGTGQLFSAALRTLMVPKVETSSSNQDSDRSQQVQSQFRVSQSQALAEANQTIAKGNKNL